MLRAFAELHGGEMTIESRLGEGTAVTVRLPVLLAPRSNGSGGGSDGFDASADEPAPPTAQVIAFHPQR